MLIVPLWLRWEADLATLGEVLDVTVATVLPPRNGSSCLLGSLLKLWGALLQPSQKSPNGLRQIGCITASTAR